MCNRCIIHVSEHVIIHVYQNMELHGHLCHTCNTCGVISGVLHVWNRCIIHVSEHVITHVFLNM